MRPEVRSRLLNATSESADALAEALAGVEDDWRVTTRRSQLSAARAYDPGASLDEELLLHLESPVPGELEGGLLADGGGVLRPLQEAVSAAVGDVTSLDLVEVSAGSTVLHFRVKAPPAEPVGEVPVDSSRADPGMRRLLQFVAALEERHDDMRHWTDVLDGARKLVTLLIKLSWDADLTWLALDGQVRRAALRESGRRYYEELTETAPSPDETVVSGRVTELRESGLVTLKAGTSPRSARHEVHVELEDLLRERFELGQQVSLLVRRVTQRDRLGREQSLELFYLGRARPAEQQELGIEDAPPAGE